MRARTAVAAHPVFALLLVITLPLACSRGEAPPSGITPDLGSPDVDSGPSPAEGGAPEGAPPPPDLGPPPPDLPPCGNGWLDPDELCDKAIPAGQQGACPTDCDDQQPCTQDSLVGSAEQCTASCEHALLSNCCGNGTPEGTEQCDDGNLIDNDACDSQCKLPGGHLLLTEVAISPTEAEFIEIFNPTDTTLSLEDVYLADRIDYYQIPAPDLIKGVGSDFIVRFPPGAQIEPGTYVVVALSGLAYRPLYGTDATYEVRPSDDPTPDMVAATAKSLGAVAGLTDAGEVIVLFSWDGLSDRVQDIDYLAWGSSTTARVQKTTSDCIDGPDADPDAICYLPDTLAADQSAPSAPPAGGSLSRCDFREGSELHSGGNGLLGHDETSEGLSSTWAKGLTAADRTPGAGPPTGLCK